MRVDFPFFFALPLLKPVWKKDSSQGFPYVGVSPLFGLSRLPVYKNPSMGTSVA